MKNRNILLIVFLCFSSLTFSQKKEQEREARAHVREGNTLYNNLKFADAEIAYKKALTKKTNYPKANYNLGNALYQQNRNKEALEQYELVAKTTKDKNVKAEVFHNMGNTFMNEKKYQPAVEAYKNALRNNPKDEETRYNLALAQKMLKNQQQQNKNNKNKDQKNKDNKDQNKKDNKENKDKKDDKDKKDKKDDNKKQQNDKKEDEKEKKQPKKQPNQLSKQQMQQLLEAMSKEENKTQKKINKKKVKGRKIKREKDW